MCRQQVAAVGPDSLVTATVMPTMSAFGVGSHIFSDVVSADPEDIFRDDGFCCTGIERSTEMWCP